MQKEQQNKKMYFRASYQYFILVKAMKKLRQIVFILHDLVCSKDDNNGLKWKFAALDYAVAPPRSSMAPRCGYLQIRREILTVVKRTFVINVPRA